MFINKEEFKEAFIRKLEEKIGKKKDQASEQDAYLALGALISERINQKWLQNNQKGTESRDKQVYFFSMEFLLGRLLGNNLLNLDMLSLVKTGLNELGFRFTSIEEKEKDAGLGNGGLGRLAACFLDSLASLDLPGHGYGLRYKYGMFDQRFIDGNQVELPDQWLSQEYVWKVRREEEAVEVRFGGHILTHEQEGKLHFEHVDYEQLRAVPYDVPVIGYHNDTVNTLRLWSAEPTEEDILVKAKKEHSCQNLLDHQRSLESITEFLYPDDSTEEGKRLRLKQEYFLVSSGVQCVIRSFEKLDLSWSLFPDYKKLHINDTHPTLIIPELMRILMDEKKLGWEEAWQITQASVSYTNHTTLSEALETWPVEMIRSLLPRIYMIIEEINERFCRMLWESSPGNFDRIAKLAIIADGQVKMAHLSIVGSSSVNGVAKMHTEILKKREMKLFYDIFPDRFNNKTNGISHRRWLMYVNPLLTNAIDEAIGEQWKKEPERLQDLLYQIEDASFLDTLNEIKQKNKQNFASWVEDKTGVQLDPTSIFDVQIKRLHGYKRQLLNALHIIHLYNQIKCNPTSNLTPRTFIFGAKAASSYHFAKKVIKLINTIAQIVNNDADVKDKLKVVFLENYSVSLAERIIPAANISEQISTAGKEASGTGNMKLMMNGALTLGTMDGANVEICDVIGNDHMYSFGLSAEEVQAYYDTGIYSAKETYEEDERIRRTLDQLIHYSPFSKGGTEFREIYDELLFNNDEYFVLRDFNSYVNTQQQISYDYQDIRNWNRKCLVNIAHSGVFSSDRTIKSYAAEIWGLNSHNTVNGLGEENGM
ncbi:glycogen/starch/alpha-glucan family phosphorylase [Aquibacillus albus]|uniref:Alpha-1,4 glucan phosphorylase n=1 Tax=Aquibacillus albus TaxID=1168171 RepID=A0ABS2MXY7_9BACI|nr:starch phosphorylase [Aquibacillus albus]